jgi:hypothetical protein
MTRHPTAGNAMEAQMIARLSCTLSIAALVAGAGALAQPPAGGNTGLTASKSDPNRLICRTLDGSGSRLERQRACHTAAEWAEIRRQTRQAIDRIQSAHASN